MFIDFQAITMLLTVFQVGGIDISGPLTNSLNEFGTTVAESLPSVVAALLLLGIAT